MMPLWISLELVLPFLTAIMCLLFMRYSRIQTVISFLGALSLSAVAAFFVTQTWDSSAFSLEVGNWPAPFGIVLAIDGLSAAMLSVTALLLVATLLLNKSFAKDKDREFFHPLMHFLVLGLNGAFITADIFNLYVWFEVLLLSSFALLSMGLGFRESLRTRGLTSYVVLNIVGSLFFLFGIAMIYHEWGTLNLAHLAEKFQQQTMTASQHYAGLFLLGAFVMKAGLIPFHIWLLPTYPLAHPVVAAFFSGLVTKVGLYAILRFFVDAGGGAFSVTGTPLWIVAIVSMVVGVLGAASQMSMRNILSFHIVSQVGYIAWGLSMGTQAAVAASIFYLIHHMIVKGNLFFVAAALQRLNGTEDLTRLGGLSKLKPFLAILFLVPALSLAGLPPFSGFWAKFLLLRESLLMGHWFSSAIALAVSLLTAFSMLKIWTEVFWKEAPKTAATINISARSLAVLYAPLILLSLATLIISLYPGPIIDFCFRMADVFFGTGPYGHGLPPGGSSS